MRKPRLEHPGALYHVTVRGNQRQKVFLEDEDYARYLRYLGEKLASCRFTLHAYCLMKDHIHLLLEQDSVHPLSRLMQRLQSAYTNHYTHKYGKPGHVFQGRYRAVLVDKERYLPHLVGHLHLHPHRARLKDADRYPWSSHRQYLGVEPHPPAKVDCAALLSALPPARSGDRYAAFMRKRRRSGRQEPFGEVRDGRFLGDARFERRSHERAGVRKKAEPFRVHKSIKQIWTQLLRERRLRREPRGWSRSRLMAEATYVAVEGAGLKQREVAEYFKVKPTTVNKAVKRLEQRWMGKKGARRGLLQWAGGL